MTLEALDLATNFSRFDWVIVVIYLAATVAIGIYANRYVANMSDYIVAGRSLRSSLGIATMIGSEFGLVTVMYMAQKGVTGGFAALHIALAGALGALFVGLTGFIVVPLREMGVMTIPEFYEKRFSRGVRVLGGVILFTAGVLNMGMFLKAGGQFVTAMTGLEENLLKIVMTVLLALVLLYTILGGMVSVVITDYLQFVVLSFGMLLASALAFHEVGWTNIVNAVESVHGKAGFDLFVSEGFGVEYVLWMILAAIIGSGLWPVATMRACSAQNTQVVKRLYSWSSVGFLIRSLIPIFLGICAVAFFFRHESAASQLFLDGKLVGDSDTQMQLMPLFLSQILPAGLIGLIGAGMLAAFMSTHDSYLLCWSSVLVQDIIAPCFPGELSTKTRLLLARLVILLIGIYLLVFGLWYDLGGQALMEYLWITGAIYFTGAFALLALGIYWNRASTTGAYLALIAGASAAIGLGPVKELLGLDKLSDKVGDQRMSAWIGISTTLLAIGLMVLGSLIFPDTKREDPSS